jgi:hypothetical protein
VTLDAPTDEPHMEVRCVEHPSRVYLAIETDDIEEAGRRLKRLGAKRRGAVKSRGVMEAPTGKRFCAVPPPRAEFDN